MPTTKDFNASGLPPEANPIANALGSFIVDAPELQAELVSLLMPQARQQIAEHCGDLGTLNRFVRWKSI